MAFERASGILLHPTSLPGGHGVGDLGQGAYDWLDFLERSGQRLWQVLPLGPTGFGDSPYQCFSAFAGNPYLISLDRLVEEGLLEREALEDSPDFSEDEVDYGAVIPFKLGVLNQSYEVFKERASERQKESFNTFCDQQAYWLEDYALFMSCKEANEGRAWNEWDEGLRKRKKRALNAHQKEHVETIQRWRYWQWLFYTQWLEVKRYANERRHQHHRRHPHLHRLRLR